MKKGFTLIELLVVIVIIAVLAAVGLPQYFNSVEMNRALEMLSVTRDLRNAYEVYYVRHGKTPNALEDLSINIPAAPNADGTYTLKSGALVFASVYEVYVTKDYDGGNYGFAFMANKTKGPGNLVCIADKKTPSLQTMCTDFGGVLDTVDQEWSYNTYEYTVYNLESDSPYN